MSEGGRPKGSIKLTDELQETIVNMIRGGNYMETAAAAAGIDKSTLYDWLRRGAKAKAYAAKANIDIGDMDADDQAYISFSYAVQKAQAKSEALALAQIIMAANDGQWQAAAWRLERRFPDRWGRRSEHNVRMASMPTADVSGEALEEYQKAVSQFFGMDADSDADSDG